MRVIGILSTWHLLFMAMVAAMSHVEPFRCIMYLTGQHDVLPPKRTLQDVTHVIMAFMRSETFNVDDDLHDYPMFTSVSDIHKRLPDETKVMIAIGGWGDTKGFEEAARNGTTRKRWARQVAAMVTATGADGIDIDWEYPGGNRDDYKQIPNSEREWEIESFVSLLQELRSALGPDKLLSAAVPGKEVDLMAFTPTTVPKIMKEVDFLNVMTYDLMNRRDTITKHHSGVSDSQDSIQRYIHHGASPSQLNLGLGYYVKWFMTQDCSSGESVGCPTQLLEDPETGADLGRTGSFSWHDEIPEDISKSFERAKMAGAYDEDGSYYYWDKQEWRWWTFDTEESIRIKFSRVVPELGVGGAFAWGIGEDAPSFEHFKSTIVEVRKTRKDMGAKTAEAKEEL
ncbi:extracellular chitinase [Fusarium beomiforme]|uniref:chitinase n=1 Tax=Fusarium beomiforme TaxID=44412 RepID=A0A9P5AGN2_9HYPO|nr:extracellular chitinase [Fusarium beomiforme]